MGKSLQISCIMLLFTSAILGQDKSFIDNFESYTAMPREVVTLHLNKTVFLKGEEIGFQAYVFEKGTNELSLQTKNLYVVLLNAKDSVVKKKLVLMENGFGHGTFTLDKTLKVGDYRIEAFTNWMRNFSEKNHYSQQIHLIDTNTPLANHMVDKDKGIDAQFLPEGGHALAGVENTFGVIIRDSNGYGVSNAKGLIKDKNDRIIADFKVDNFGIGRFLMTPRPNTEYMAFVDVDDQTHRFELGPFRSKGINLQVTELEKTVGIVFNKSGFQDETFDLAIHNGLNINVIEVDFASNPKQIILIEKENLHKGINIFTLFDNKGNPLLERLYFNFDALKDYSFTKIKAPAVKKDLDSIEITLAMDDINLEKLSRLSISVLPNESLAYGSPHTVASYLHVIPYVRGNVQDASYYFTDPDNKKKFQFDNLLLTQGWSSYDWFSIENKKPEYLFDFEKGLSVIGQDNQKISKELFLHPLENNDFKIFSVDEESNTFIGDLLFPYEDEVIRVSDIGGQSLAKAAAVYLRFKPNAIPKANWQNDTYNGLKNMYTVLQAQSLLSGFQGFQEIITLEEVNVTANRRMERLKKIRDRSSGQVFIFGENDFRRNLFLDDYLRRIGFGFGGGFQQGPITSATDGTIPLLYVNDMILNDFDNLDMWRMDEVDYIEINRFGRRTGALHPSGEIRVYTDPSLARVNFSKQNPYNEVQVPLAFSRPKRFYNPKYNNYSDAVYKAFGAIDWHPNLSADGQGNVSFKIPNLGLDQAQMFIEGVVNGNQLVSEIKTIRL
ncbi:TonB-dependent receptor plug [Croceitalea dokdonensis DOKDO 023]|uniref:TonB-dependent receptor plug n=1 Tax=Croceitalea dokdonensis DOKDO 023 TaxID=1300341 RepID=A0A0P7AW50_9FLAO|nr:hypothetical protein [Croceitalea dokdonensis]KPM32248.1 TonB-dependent receptor plug [Croceitalea dokdonensis DOKDO 023]